jgi:hypothetical protein
MVEEVGLPCRVDPTQARYLLKHLEAEDLGVEQITEEEQDHLEAELYVQEIADAIEDIEDGHSE